MMVVHDVTKRFLGGFLVAGVFFLFSMLPGFGNHVSAASTGELSVAFLDTSGNIFLYFVNANGTVNETPIDFFINTDEAGNDSFHSEMVGDVNGDNWSDIVIVDENTENATTFLNNQDNTFTKVVTTNLTLAPTYGIGDGGDEKTHLGDVNGDGYDDIVFMYRQNASNNGIYVHLGVGDGTFATSPLVSQDGSIANAGGELGDSTKTQLGGDFNGDGTMDLLWAEEATSIFYIYMNNGNGTFTGAVEADVPDTEFNVGQNDTEVTLVGDSNGDGCDDVFYHDSITKVWLNNCPGGGVFSGFTAQASTPAGRSFGISNEKSTFVHDINGDNLADILFIDEDNGGVTTTYAEFSDSSVVTGAWSYSAEFGTTSTGNSLIGYFAAPEENTPDTFNLGGPVEEAKLSTKYTSNTITVGGINTRVAISITGGEYKVNDGSFTSSADTVTLNDTVQVRVTSSNSYTTTVTGTLDIGGVTDTYVVTTKERDRGGATSSIGRIFNFGDDNSDDDSDDNDSDYLDPDDDGDTVPDMVDDDVDSDDSDDDGLGDGSEEDDPLANWGDSDSVNDDGVNYDRYRLSGKSSEDNSDTCPDDEYQAAYSFAHENQITTIPSCPEADMNGNLIRAHTAKMMSNYAINVLGQEPDTTKECPFADMDDQPEEMQRYAEVACQLGLMGLKGDGETPAENFNPNAYVDKAQFATILSRMLFGDEHESDDPACRWCDHVAAMEDEGVITVTTDLMQPLRRAYAMIMLMRAGE